MVHRSSLTKFNVFPPTPILDQNCTLAASARNLGMTFDFNFRKHIFQMCRCYFYHIRGLRRICRYLPLSVAKTVATALFSNRLRYCHSLYHNIALKDIMKLQAQRMQNCLSRVVTKSPRFSHSVPLLKSIHWQPILHRIIFKICTITYQTLLSGQPAYLHSLLTPARRARQLRSSTSHLLFIPRIKTNIGTRAFSNYCTYFMELITCQC